MAFYFGYHGNQISSWNTIIWRNLKEDHLRNIPVKFGKNPVYSFWGEILLRKSLRMDKRTNEWTDAQQTQPHDNSSLAFGQWNLKWGLWKTLWESAWNQYIPLFNKVFNTVTDRNHHLRFIFVVCKINAVNLDEINFLFSIGKEYLVNCAIFVQNPGNPEEGGGGATLLAYGRLISYG